MQIKYKKITLRKQKIMMGFLNSNTLQCDFPEIGVKSHKIMYLLISLRHDSTKFSKKKTQKHDKIVCVIFENWTDIRDILTSENSLKGN